MRTSLLFFVAIAAACAASRTTIARYPNAPVAFDRAGADPKALAIADKMFAAAGGASNWDKAKQIRWHQSVAVSGKVLIDGEEAWDRWNARHYGRLARHEGDVVVAYDLYGTHTMGFLQNAQKHAALDDEGKQHALKTARAAFDIDTALLTLPFLMLEPGTKLEYVGPAKDDSGNETGDELKVTFGDPARKIHEFHVFVDRTSNLMTRVEIYTTGATEKTGYTLKDWTTSGGMQFATTRTNLGDANEVTTIKDIKISEPDDELYIQPL